MAKKKKEDCPAGLPAWMATYGDLVTLLLCFFVLLFATSSVDAEKFQAIAHSFNDKVIIINAGGKNTEGTGLGSGIMSLPNLDRSIHDSKENFKKKKEEAEKMASEFKTYFAENKLSKDIEVIVDGDEVLLNFKDGILFSTAQETLNNSSKEILSGVAELLLEYPEKNIKIEGHTDNVPIISETIKNNWYLSSNRALAVLTYFIQEKKMIEDVFVVEGKGEYSPIAPNDTEENRAKNRRVEIRITNNEIT